ncbi:hypothetical protein [Haloplasma contractile]|uniref:Lipoprotein n=1 Tax=Haloplasma contractile SSD-17B TaxID=1033810 RepID=U2EA00_9MOLU|nr:hypothetical protein [Haloplasma contractile]ERJ11671.1 lipoprotein [Haloplasma contractile SSD-17B]
MHERKLSFNGNYIYIFFVLLALSGCAIFKDDSPYPSGGRDTEIEFGDRRFVFLLGYTEIKTGNLYKKWNLYDRKNRNSIEDNVFKYKELNPYVYTIGLD